MKSLGVNSVQLQYKQCEEYIIKESCQAWPGSASFTLSDTLELLWKRDLVDLWLFRVTKVEKPGCLEGGTWEILHF